MPCTRPDCGVRNRNMYATLGSTVMRTTDYLEQRDGTQPAEVFEEASDRDHPT